MSAIVVDTSAIVAILANEPGRIWLSERLSEATERLITAPTALELGIVLESRAPAAVGIASRAIRDARISVESIDASLADRALQAWRRFGKGRHPAGLNYGDCFTYALAEERGCPILCVGRDFAQTDLPVLIPPSG